MIDARASDPHLSPADVRVLVALLRWLGERTRLGPTAVLVSKADAPNGFAPAVNLSLDASSGLPKSIVASNLDVPSNGDTDVDLAVLLNTGGSIPQGSIQVLRNDSQNGEPLALTVLNPVPVNNANPIVLVAGSFDANLGNDLVTLNQGGGSDDGLPPGGSGPPETSMGSARVIGIRLGSCPDATHDGLVNIDDLLAVINQWGNCPALPATCTADVNNSRVVNIDDLLEVINHWGVCPP